MSQKLSPNDFQRFGEHLQRVQDQEPDPAPAGSKDKFDFPQFDKRFDEKYWEPFASQCEPSGDDVDLGHAEPWIKYGEAWRTAAVARALKELVDTLAKPAGNPRRAKLAFRWNYAPQSKRKQDLRRSLNVRLDNPSVNTVRWKFGLDNTLEALTTQYGIVFLEEFYHRITIPPKPRPAQAYRECYHADVCDRHAELNRRIMDDFDLPVVLIAGHDACSSYIEDKKDDPLVEKIQLNDDLPFAGFGQHLALEWSAAPDSQARELRRLVFFAPHPEVSFYHKTQIAGRRMDYAYNLVAAICGLPAREKFFAKRAERNASLKGETLASVLKGLNAQICKRHKLRELRRWEIVNECVLREAEIPKELREKPKTMQAGYSLVKQLLADVCRTHEYGQECANPNCDEKYATGKGWMRGQCKVCGFYYKRTGFYRPIELVQKQKTNPHTWGAPVHNDGQKCKNPPCNNKYTKGSTGFAGGYCQGCRSWRSKHNGADRPAEKCNKPFKPRGPYKKTKDKAR